MSAQQIPHIPRNNWQAHNNYPNHVLLLGAHDNFRHISKHLVDHAWSGWNAGAQRPPSSALQSLFVRWKNAMKNHEHYEERKLYPYLARHYDTTFEELKVQHLYLGKLDHDVRSAFDAGDALRFAVALRNHDETLRQHLNQEEEAVIPLLLELDRDEFTRFRGG